MIEFDCIKIGRQWGQSYEIDVAGVNMKNELSVLGECKWSNTKVGISVYEELHKKAFDNKLPLSDNVKYFLFSKSGFTDDLKKIAEVNSNIILVEDVFK